MQIKFYGDDIKDWMFDIFIIFLKSYTYRTQHNLTILW